MSAADPLVVADQEITEGKARLVSSVLCGPCQWTIAREWATSVGIVWRVHDRKDFVTDELGRPGAPIRCDQHGEDHLVTRRR